MKRGLRNNSSIKERRKKLLELAFTFNFTWNIILVLLESLRKTKPKRGNKDRKTEIVYLKNTSNRF